MKKLTQHHRRVDANQADIVVALRSIGCRVQSLATLGGGVPDLLVWHPRSGLMLLEVKAPKGKLTPTEASWHLTWRGAPVYVVTNAIDAIRVCIPKSTISVASAGGVRVR